MSRHTKRSSDTGFAALTIEGGLIAPDQVQAIASAAPDQKTAADYGCPKGTGLRDEITRYFRIAQAHWQGSNSRRCSRRRSSPSICSSRHSALN